MKSYVLYSVTLFSLLAPCLAVQAELQYKNLNELIKDFINPSSHPEASYKEFLSAIKKVIATSPRYRNAKYSNFCKGLETQANTKNARLIGLYLFQNKHLFKELEGLLKGKSKDQLISIMETRLKK